MGYVNEKSIQTRKDETAFIREKYPDRCPVIVEKALDSRIAQIEKRKYLVPMDLTLGSFLFVIRQRIKLKSEEALFLFINGHVPPTGALISELFKKNKAVDGYLYICYDSENTFGSCLE